MSSLQNSMDEDASVYIKLPYTEQIRTSAEKLSKISKEELEPPMRRGAIPPSHSILTRRPPPPIANTRGETLKDHTRTDYRDRDVKGNNHPKRRVGAFFSHEEHHPGVLNALRNEFETWIEKHGKRYESQGEKEHRFHVWKKNHFR